MVRKIIRFTPDQFGYKDRGKMKWQGLMLSDHTEKLKICMMMFWLSIKKRKNG